MKIKLILLLIASLFSAPSLWAAPSCHQLLEPQFITTITRPALAEAPKPTIFETSEGVRKLIEWEQLSNQDRWHKPTGDLKIDYVAIPKTELKLRADPSAPPAFLRFFTGRVNFKWFRHPLNESDLVPYRTRAATGSINGRYSASRSVFVEIGGSLFSLKMGTDHPHPNAAAQPGKADTLNDSDISMRRSQHIRSFDAEHGHTPDMYILTEILSIAHSQNGFSVRDLRPLQDGHLYLPAFSIPYAGRKISTQMKVAFEKVWGRAYAKSLGRAKAELLLRYGLQMKTPNAQNWLLQLDTNMRPTGKIYMRDVADSNYVDFVAKNIGAEKELEADRVSNYSIKTDLSPNWENSVWQMNEGGVTPEISNGWGKIHNEAYISTIVNTLGMTVKPATIGELEMFLKSVEGQLLLQKYGASRAAGN